MPSSLVLDLVQLSPASRAIGLGTNNRAKLLGRSPRRPASCRHRRTTHSCARQIHDHVGQRRAGSAARWPRVDLHETAPMRADAVGPGSLLWDLDRSASG